MTILRRGLADAFVAALALNRLLRETMIARPPGRR